MTRSQRKTSRALVAAVGGALVLGLAVTAVKVSSSRRGQAPAREQTPRGAVLAAPAVDSGTPKADGKASPKLAALPGAAVLETPTAPVSPTTKPAGTTGSAAAGTAPTGGSLPLMAGVEQTPLASPAPSAATAAAAPAPTTKPANVQLASLTQTAHTTDGAAKPQAPIVAPASLADAKAKIDAGKLIAARDALNQLLTSGSLSEADAKAAKQMLAQVNQTVVFSARKFNDDPLMISDFKVPPGAALDRIAKSHDVTTELLLRINGISDPRKLRAGQYLKIPKGPFHAVVSKKAFTLEIWQGEPNAKGSAFVMSFPVGLGKDDSTPTGTWAVINKVPNPTYYSPRGEGVIAADDHKNPLGEYWIGLTGTDGHAVGKESYGIHGTIDPASIGKQESMGCIRLLNENVAQVYQLLTPKSLVTVID
jgi:LysM repeat protein